MTMAIKVFSTRHDYESLEQRVNAWLEKNTDVVPSIMSTAQVTGEGTAADNFVLTFLYARKHGRRELKTQRRHQRKDLFEVLDYTVDGRYYRDFIEDMSEGGVFIRTGQKFPLNQALTMQFMPKDTGRPFTIKGEVVRVLPEGVGVAFRPESQLHVDLVKDFIRSMNPS